MLETYNILLKGVEGSREKVENSSNVFVLISMLGEVRIATILLVKL